MNVNSLSNSGVEYTRLVRQLEQQQEYEEAQQKAADTVQQTAQSASASAQNNTSVATQAQSQTSAVAEASQQLAESLESGSGSDTNTILLNKANSGAELSSSELSQLKELDSALYAQAVRAQKVREEARARMQANPSSASDVAGRALAEAESDAEMRAVMDEYVAFATKYDQAAFGARVLR